MRRLETEIGMNLADETDCCGVTLAQCHLLLETAIQGSASLGELADNLSADKGALSRTVDGLVREGLLSREENPANRRKITVSLTPSGEAKTAKINELCNASYERVFARIPAEKHGQIIESVALLASAMKISRTEDQSSCCRKK